MKNGRIFLATVSIVALLLITACGSQGVPAALNYDLEDFSFTNQEGQAFSKSDLTEHVTVANFIFTNCETVCPPMTANMAKLQDLVNEEGLKDVAFVSFSVDPETDQPEVLKAFAENFKVDFTNWNFLTGYTQAEIAQFAQNNFKTLAQKPENDDQVIHGTNFYLIDKEGKIIKDYSGVSDVPFEEIIKHIKMVQTD
jgi:protein SCO1/2